MGRIIWFCITFAVQTAYSEHTTFRARPWVNAPSRSPTVHRCPRCGRPLSNHRHSFDGSDLHRAGVLGSGVAATPFFNREGSGPVGSINPRRRMERRIQPSGVNGNPSFQYFYGGSFCQATLISSKNNTCVAATAAHCVQRAMRRSNHEPDLGAFHSEGYIETANFGTAHARILINANYPRGRLDDAAALIFSCDGPNDAAETPLSITPLQPGETVQYGKLMDRRSGLYSAIAYSPHRLHRKRMHIYQGENPWVFKGDSGGGLFRRKEDGALELVGVLSGGPERRTPNAWYSVNESLDFLRRVIQRTGA